MINLREWALPVYTIMMQMAAGSMLILWLLYNAIARRWDRATADRISHNLVMIIFVTAFASVVGSHYHLSRPFFSVLALSSLGTSWLSREVAFTVLFVLLMGVVWLLQRYKRGSSKLLLAVGWLAVLMGIATVYCMSRVYLLPTQVAWNSITTPIAFFGAMLLLGGMAVAALLLMNLYLALLRTEADPELGKHIYVTRRALPAMATLTVVAAVVELLNYAFQIRLLSESGPSAQGSLDLLLELYGVLFRLRLALLGGGAAGLIAAILWQRNTRLPVIRLMAPVYVVFLLLLMSEVLGRFLFYAVHVRIGM